MPILNLTGSRNAFEFSRRADLDPIVLRVQSELFGENGYSVIRNFIEEDLANRIREFYIRDNKDAFKVVRSPLFTFHGQSSIIYYLRSPHQKPALIMSAIRLISLFRNMVFSCHEYYKQYCRRWRLNPGNYEEVLDHQEYHTWSRVSWYRERDGQCHHKDKYGELAALLFLSKKGIHWKKGGLYVYDDEGNQTADLDQLCNPGDLLLLDQPRIIHSVEPIIGASPGRLIIYVPIVPEGYIQRWFVFEGYPWRVYFNSKDVSVAERLAAVSHNAFRNLFSSNRVHPSRLFHHHKTLNLSQ